MDRRNFLGKLVDGLAATAAVRTWPFRVYSFPTTLALLSKEEISRIYLEPAIKHMFARVDMLMGFDKLMPEYAVRIYDVDELNKEITCLPANASPA